MRRSQVNYVEAKAMEGSPEWQASFPLESTVEYVAIFPGEHLMISNKYTSV